jgi:hypothetical protein
MSVRRAHQLLVGITLMVGTTFAAADVVSPPPTDCPPGTTAATNHAGPHCSPASCKDGKSCSAGEVCATELLCWVESVYANRTGEHRVEVVRGPCRNGQCSEGTCRAERVCMAPELVAAAGRPGTLGTRGLGRSAETGGRRAPAASLEPPLETTDRPSPPPAGCRGTAIASAVAGGMMAALLGAIAFLLRRRRKKTRAVRPRTTRRT